MNKKGGFSFSFPLLSKKQFPPAAKTSDDTEIDDEQIFADWIPVLTEEKINTTINKIDNEKPQDVKAGEKIDTIMSKIDSEKTEDVKAGEKINTIMSKTDSEKPEDVKAGEKIDTIMSKIDSEKTEDVKAGEKTDTITSKIDSEKIQAKREFPAIQKLTAVLIGFGLVLAFVNYFAFIDRRLVDSGGRGGALAAAAMAMLNLCGAVVNTVAALVMRDYVLGFSRA